jgi:hypothetical protein
MDTKSILSSTEVMIGTGIVIAGALAQVVGLRDVFTMALIPFGAGLILSDIVSRVARSKRDRERVRIRIRRDDK